MAKYVKTEQGYKEPTELVDSRFDSKMNKNNPVGTGSFSMGRKAGSVVGDKSHAEGNDTTASGFYSHSEGSGTTASGSSSHAEGESTNNFTSVITATNPTNTVIINAWKTNKFNLAKGTSSHVEGKDNLALGDSSHAEGSYTTASGTSSHAEGLFTKAIKDYQHAQGKFNIQDSAGTYADIIGNGTSDTARSNAATVDWLGNAWYSGDVYVGSTSGINKDAGSKKLATEEYVSAALENYTPDPSLGITNATVGQIAKITAVDNNGKPTAWEPVDMPSGKDGADGQDGYSPSATVAQTDSGATITITDKNGTTTATVTNGKDGADGQPGADGSPGNDGVDGKDGVSVTHSWDGTVLTVNSASGTSSADLKGAAGADGSDGKSAYQYAKDGGYTGTEEEFAAKLAAEMPAVPSNVSAFVNDAGYLTEHQDISGKIDKPASGVVGQVLAVKTVDENGKPTEFACVYQTSGGDSGSGGEVVETTFKVWGPDATGAAEGDVVTELNSGYYDKNGNQVQTSTFGCTVPLIEINEDATIYAYNLYDFEAGYAITFFDSSKAVISGVGGTGNTSTRITGNQTVPSGAKYVAVTLLKADSGMYCQITTRETVITDSLGTQVGFLEADVATLKTQVAELTNELDSSSYETETFDYSALSSCITKGYYDTNGVLQSTTSWRCTNFIPVSEGDKLTVKLTTYNTTMAIAYFDENKAFISGVIGDTWSWSTSVYPLSGEQVIPSGAYFMRVSVFVADYATEQYVTINRAIVKNIQNRLGIINGKPLNVLILGDSYSAMGRWVDGMKEVIDIKNLVNLGVSSATLKDRYADRTSYPYSSRPDKADGSGNTNTLSSQIQKLKRLMAGTDLDSGESQIYASETDYPDVIIIEGGMNDAPDSDEVVATYHDQFMTSKTAYYKQNSSASVIQTTVWVKPAIDTIDRTCFAGAYRYLCEELLALFPNAQIFLTTASHMNYFTVNPNDRYGKIAEQQRKCADIMSYTVIDWHAEGNLNTMMIGLNGSGTESDPYTPVGGDEYTTDLLHPNDKGGKRYGRLAGKVIAQKYLGF